MTNEKLWESYDKYTKDLSNVSRQLAFAAAALSWFFKSTENVFPEEILIALRFIIVFFIADVLQYLLGALFIRFWTRYHENKKYKETGDIKGDYPKPAWLDYPAYLMWWIKIISLICSYVYIGLYLFIALKIK